MSRLRVKGPRSQLSNPVVQWEIMRQLTMQKGIRRTFNVGNVSGEVILEHDAKISDAVELIKARGAQKPRGGELDLVKHLSEEMSAVHTRRVETMLESIEGILEGDEINKSFTPPADVARAAERGLELRRKYGRGGLDVKQAAKEGIGSGVQRAVNLKNRNNISLDTVKRMKSFFARHRKNKDGRTPKGEPSAGAIAWLLWGGDAGDRWSKRIVERESR